MEHDVICAKGLNCSRTPCDNITWCSPRRRLRLRWDRRQIKSPHRLSRWMDQWFQIDWNQGGAGVVIQCCSETQPHACSDVKLIITVWKGLLRKLTQQHWMLSLAYVGVDLAYWRGTTTRGGGWRRLEVSAAEVRFNLRGLRKHVLFYKYLFEWNILYFITDKLSVKNK